MGSRIVLVWMVGAALIAPSAAFGQNPPTIPNGTSGGAGVGPVGRMTDQQASWRFESEEMRRRNQPTREEAEARYGAERMALADRVQALVGQGQCREARALANEAGDRQMALRVRQTCRAR